MPSASLYIAVAFKAVKPPQRWTAEEFRSQGRWLMLTQHHTAQIVQRKAVPVIQRISKAIFRSQLADVVRQATFGTVVMPATGKAAYMANLPPGGRNIVAEMGAWQRAIENVFGRGATVDTVLQLMPPIRSIIDQGYARTGKLLSNTARPASVNLQLQRDASAIADKITNIPETTRRQIVHIVETSVNDGLSMVETAQQIMDVMPAKNEARALTIARTETNNAYTDGALAAYDENGDVLEVSVIGCSQIEQDWTWNGRPTCNITNVPMANARELEWHPNHVGTLVATKFRD